MRLNYTQYEDNDYLEPPVMLGVILVRSGASISHIHQWHKVIVPMFQCTAGPCSGGLCPAPLGGPYLRIPKDTRPDTAEQGPQSRETGADHANMDFNSAPVAHFHVVPCFLLGVCWTSGTEELNLQVTFVVLAKTINASRRMTLTRVTLSS